MSLYRIESKAGEVYGTYEGQSAREAWEAMVREGGEDPSDPQSAAGRIEDWIIIEEHP